MKIFFTIISILLFVSNILYSQTWVQHLNGRSVWSLANDNLGNVYAGGLTSSNSRIWKSVNGGETWDTIFVGAGQTMWDFGFDVANNIYVANFSNGLLKSTNNGLNFSLTPISAFNNKNLQGVECGSAGHVFVTTSMGFFRSADNGQNFIETALTGFNCLPVLVDKDSSNIVYVGVSSAGGSGIGFYRSTDNGMTFSANLNPGKNGYNLFQNNNGDVYMITTTSPYNFDRSTNKGLSWTTVSNTAPSQRGITRSGLGNFYTAGNGGVFRSTNGGLNFTNHNFTLSSTPVLFNNYNNVLKILTGTSGTTNGGVWSFIEGIVQYVSSQNNSGLSFELSQNYPNPFNPFTTITYKLEISEFVSLKVYDALGIEVADLVNEKQSPGKYQVNWHADHFNSGVYFYTLKVKNFIETKKMLIIK
ncbi:MAG: T9SS type A sorting domain-containing protein [Ignavibacteria bacterium]